MRKLQFKSFATRMSLYVLSFTLVVFTVIMGLFYAYSRDKVTEYAVNYTHEQLQNMTARISSLLLTVETTLNHSVWMIEENLANPDSLRRVITAVAKNNDLILSSGIAFVPDYYKEKGKYFMPYVSLRDGRTDDQVLGGQDYDYPCMDWYLIPKLLKRSYWSEPYYDEGGGNFIMSTYAMPLYDSKGEVYAIFTANISLSQFTDMVDRLKPYESSYTFLLSRNGCYLTHKDESKIMNETIFSTAFEQGDTDLEHIGREMLQGHTGTRKLRQNNRETYAFYTAIPDIGWSISNICPASVILADLYTVSKQIIYLFLIGMLVLFFIIYLIIRRVVRPLSEFSHSARVIATGRFDVELPQVTSRDEIKTLHDSLVYMQQSLASYVTELRDTTASKERIESELSIAREIQMGMIPKIFPPFPDRKDVDLYALLQPAKEVGGDLYDFFIEDEHLYFIIGDVSGKGVPASLFMAITRSLFRTLSPHAVSPASIVTELNNAFSENNEANMFVTLIVGILDLRNGLLKLCNAGHNPPALILPDGKASYMNLKKHLFVGVMENYDYTDEEYMLERGTKLFLYTDGVVEAENERKQLYGDERLIKTLTDNASQDVRNMVNTIIHSVAGHVGEAEASDDLTILVIDFE